jgi:hypothetical protein
MRGALVGFGLVLSLSLAWAVFVLLRSWVEGEFDRAFPDCDPCGFAGYAFRMVVVTALLLGMFGVPAAIAGWLIEKVVRLAAARRPAPDAR